MPCIGGRSSGTEIQIVGPGDQNQLSIWPCKRRCFTRQKRCRQVSTEPTSSSGRGVSAGTSLAAKHVNPAFHLGKIELAADEANAGTVFAGFSVEKGLRRERDRPRFRGHCRVLASIPQPSIVAKNCGARKAEPGDSSETTNRDEIPTNREVRPLGPGGSIQHQPGDA